MSRIKPLPHWVLTDLQPAFYDSESGTVLQMTSRIYHKIEDLITDYNNFVDEINNHIEKYEKNLFISFDKFKQCIIKTMNDYIESIDTKIGLQDTNIANKFNEQDNKINQAIDYMMNNIVETTTNVINQAIENGSLNIALTYDSETESLNIILTQEGDE